MAVRLFKVWWRVTLMAAQSQLLSGWSGIGFLVAKIIRFLLFLVFLLTVLKSAGGVLGYTHSQVVLFFLTFTLVDTLTQCLFRGVYQFRNLIVTGNYDLDLLKPLPSFFRPLFGWADILDFVTLIPLTFYYFYYAFNSQGLVIGNVLLFLLLLFSSMILVTGINLIIVGVAVLTTEIDHLVLIYRDLQNMARFPTEIYRPWIRYLLTFIVPVVILITIPAKGLMGLLTLPLIAGSLAFSGLFTFLAYHFWQYSLRRYSSASS
ncbi:MAG: ABC-2 family transporter protein [Candidatus Shapirobacteria bacterium]